jgi:hypothetical protein
MDEPTTLFKPTANSLKNELRESLKLLKTDFESLKHFVEELSSEELSAATVTLTKEDLDDLISAALEIHDAANDIEFEASKIKDKLSRFVV